jgi:threonine synthase
MSYVTCLRGLGSGACYSPERLMGLCPVDGRPLEMVFDLERLRRDHPGASWYRPAVRSMWRFGALLALDAGDPADAANIVSLGEGATALLDCSTHPLARRARLRLEVKEEGRAVEGCGRNPTGSFKDRGMAMVVSMARRFGLRRLAVPTQGNAGDSLVEYALRAGLEAAVVMPHDTPGAIRERVQQCARENTRIRCDLVRGTIREAGALVKEKYVPLGWFNVATFQEPGWRIEGKKTLGLELAEPRDGGRWSVPDAIVYPTGGGTGILGMWKAFAELEALGLIDGRRPRMLAVQSAATAPLVRAIERGDADTTAQPAGHTLAVGLNVPGGVGHFRVLDILRASGGTAVAVDEEAIRTAWRECWRERGWRLSPEGAATLAALEPLLEAGCIRPGERVVAVNTGAFEKYLPDAASLLP